MCASCGTVEEVDKHRANSESTEAHGAAKAPQVKQETREPQTSREGRKGKESDERARAPEAAAPKPPVEVPAFYGGLPTAHLDPEAAALVADVLRFGREVAPRVREFWTRARALWNR
ncbi:hypothetical protein [Sorangium cellulosum]|nr:hypothetical protein [Sorangium cellulosum]